MIDVSALNFELLNTYTVMTINYDKYDKFAVMLSKFVKFGTYTSVEMDTSNGMYKLTITYDNTTVLIWKRDTDLTYLLKYDVDDIEFVDLDIHEFKRLCVILQITYYCEQQYDLHDMLMALSELGISITYNSNNEKYVGVSIVYESASYENMSVSDFAPINDSTYGDSYVVYHGVYLSLRNAIESLFKSNTNSSIVKAGWA